MAENIPPPDNTRGVPYYEKLKRDLRETLQKKRLLDKNMAALEDQIYRYEASYLEETGAGNIIKGFDNYIKGSTTASGSAGGGGGSHAGGGGGGGGGGAGARRKGQVSEGDRLFSRSSASFMRELSPASSAQTTPSHAPTPTLGNPNGPSSAREGNHATSSTAGGSAGVKAGQSNNKKKKAEKEEDENDGRGGPKRLKITYARGGVGE